MRDDRGWLAARGKLVKVRFYNSCFLFFIMYWFGSLRQKRLAFSA